MLYERSRTIEERFQKALVLIEKKRLNAGQIALELGVSRPTAHRQEAAARRFEEGLKDVPAETEVTQVVKMSPNLPTRQALR